MTEAVADLSNVPTIPCRQIVQGKPCPIVFAGVDEKVREMFRDNHEWIIHKVKK